MTTSNRSKGALLQVRHLRHVLCIVGLFCWVDCTSEDAPGCPNIDIPGLAKCYDGQPSMGMPSCYNSTRSMSNGWSIGNGDTLTVGCRKVDFDTGSAGSFRCNDGVWTLEKQPPSCLADRFAAWRIRNLEELTDGWWLHDVKFFSDAACRKQIGADEMLQSFAEGPAVSKGPPKEAVDNDRITIWKAPCVDPTSSDLCGCFTSMDEGYSVSSKKCVPGEITSGYAEEVCVNSSVKAQTPIVHTIGCPKGAVTLGVELRTPQDVPCIGILQHGQKPQTNLDHQQLQSKLNRAAGSIALERWSGRGWEEVRRWKDLNAEGAWDYLPVRDECPEYKLPEDAPQWIEVVGTARAHGAKLTLRCADGDRKQVKIECTEGVWSEMPPLVCNVPDLPLPAPPQPTAAPPDSAAETGSTMALSVFLLLLMAVVVIVLLYIARMAAQWYGERRQRELLYAMPEKDVEMPATMRTVPQRVGRDSHVSPMELRRQQLGALSTSEFKAKAAELRAQVAECIDGCSPKSKPLKKDSPSRQARDSNPSKSGTDRRDRHKSPAQSPAGSYRKRDSGRAPPVPPESVPERRKRNSQQRTSSSGSSSRRHTPRDASQINRHSEPQPQELLQHLPPPPVPPPPGPPKKSSSKAQLPPVPKAGGKSRDGSDFMLNF